MIHKNGLLHLIRPGAIHPDRPYLQALRSTYDGFIINATTLALSTKNTRTFLQNFDRRVPFLIDPKTYALARNPKYILEKQRTLGRLVDLYGLKVADLPLSPDLTEERVRTMTALVLNFQIGALENGAQQSIFDVRPMVPEALVAPYFFVRGASDEWLSTNIRFLRAAVDMKGSDDVLAVLCLSKSVLSNPSELQVIAGAYADARVAGYLLWIDNCREQDLVPHEIVAIRRMILRLKGQRNAPVINMFGGYLSALLYHCGLSGFSHSRGGGEKRKVDPAGGHRQPVHYYIPPLGIQRQAERVSLYLERIGVTTPQAFAQRICPCQVCRKAMETGLEGFIGTFEGGMIDLQRLEHRVDPEAYQSASFHYLIARFLELERVQSSTIRDLVGDLVRNARSYQDDMPGGDFSTAHLVNWAAGLTPEVLD